MAPHNGFISQNIPWGVSRGTTLGACCGLRYHGKSHGNYSATAVGCPTEPICIRSYWRPMGNSLAGPMGCHQVHHSTHTSHGIHHDAAYHRVPWVDPWGIQPQYRMWITQPVALSPSGSDGTLPKSPRYSAAPPVPSSITQPSRSHLPPSPPVTYMLSEPPIQTSAVCSCQAALLHVLL